MKTGWRAHRTLAVLFQQQCYLLTKKPFVETLDWEYTMVIYVWANIYNTQSNLWDNAASVNKTINVHI
jgi:hypothetical protein